MSNAHVANLAWRATGQVKIDRFVLDMRDVETMWVSQQLLPPKIPSTVSELTT